MGESGISTHKWVLLQNVFGMDTIRRAPTWRGSTKLGETRVGGLARVVSTAANITYWFRNCSVPGDFGLNCEITYILPGSLRKKQVSTGRWRIVVCVFKRTVLPLHRTLHEKSHSSVKGHYTKASISLKQSWILIVECDFLSFASWLLCTHTYEATAKSADIHPPPRNPLQVLDSIRFGAEKELFGDSATRGGEGKGEIMLCKVRGIV